MPNLKGDCSAASRSRAACRLSSGSQRLMLLYSKAGVSGLGVQTTACHPDQASDGCSRGACLGKDAGAWGAASPGLFRTALLWNDAVRRREGSALRSQTRGRGMTGSRQGHGCTNSGRAVAALPTRSPRRSALPGLGLFALLAVLVAGVGASSASAYECYSGNPNCASEGPLQHLVNLGGGASSTFFMPTTTTSFVYWRRRALRRSRRGTRLRSRISSRGLNTKTGATRTSTRCSRSTG